VPKSLEDKLQDEVRRRLVSIAASAGIDQGRLELEVLWLLPTEFVRMYRELFDLTFADPIKPQSDGGKDQGRVLKTAGHRSGVESGSRAGKRWVNPGWMVKSDEALEKKKNLDRKITRALVQTLSELRASRKLLESQEPTAETERPIRAAHYMKSARAQSRRCELCGYFQKSEWLRCPFHT
jgi:hypothetical protein